MSAGANRRARRRAAAARGRSALACAVAVAAGLGAHPALAQTWRISPSVGVVETYSDNFALAPDELARRGWVTDIVPGLRVDLAGARARGHLDLRLHDTRYASDSRLDDSRRYLDMLGTLEAVEKRLYLDASAAITQQNLSAFDAASTPDQPSASANQVETSVARISPRLEGDIGGFAVYGLRYGAADLRTDEPTLAGSRVSEWAGRIASAPTGARIGWALEATSIAIRNDAVGTVDDRRARATLSYALTPQLTVSVLEGQESTDFTGPRTRTDTPGAGLAWVPSGRTQVAAVVERRFFGNGHSLSLTHRTPRTAWRLTSVRDALLPGLAAGGAGTVQGLMSELLATTVADPLARPAAVRRRLEETGIAAFSPLGSSVLSARPVVYGATEASLALTGARNTLTLTAARRDQRALGPTVSGAPPSPSDDFEQRGLDANWSYRLTPLTSLTLAATSLRTQGEGEGATNSREKRYGLALSSRLGPRTRATIGVRRVSFDAGTGPGNYRENAVYASLSVRL